MTAISPPMNAQTPPSTRRQGFGHPVSVSPVHPVRGLDVTVLTAADLAVSPMKLTGLNLGGATSAPVGARIYESTSHTVSKNHSLRSLRSFAANHSPFDEAWSARFIVIEPRATTNGMAAKERKELKDKEKVARAAPSVRIREP